MAEETIVFLRQQAARCLRLAREITDQTAHQALIELAEDYEVRARAAEDANRTPASE
jgi:hypothetical protein